MKSGRMPDLTGWKPVPPGFEDMPLMAALAKLAGEAEPRLGSPRAGRGRGFEDDSLTPMAPDLQKTPRMLESL
jgi:hypothetical protein